MANYRRPGVRVGPRGYGVRGPDRREPYLVDRRAMAWIRVSAGLGLATFVFVVLRLATDWRTVVGTALVVVLLPAGEMLIVWGYRRMRGRERRRCRGCPLGSVDPAAGGPTLGRVSRELVRALAARSAGSYASSLHRDGGGCD